MNLKTKKIFIIMLLISLFFAILAIFSYFGYELKDRQIFLNLYLIFVFLFYQLIMRLLSGIIVAIIAKNKEFDQEDRFYRIFSFEEKLYKLIKVKKWKNKIITANPDQYNLKQIGLENLLRNVIIAEFVHRLIMVLSFIPLFLYSKYGNFEYIFISCLFVALIDLKYVIVQRYNRIRINSLLNIEK